MTIFVNKYKIQNLASFYYIIRYSRQEYLWRSNIPWEANISDICLGHDTKNDVMVTWYCPTDTNENDMKYYFALNSTIRYIKVHVVCI